MGKIHLDQRMMSAFQCDLSYVNPTEEQLKRIDSLSRELTEICHVSIQAANQLIFYSIIKWQNETELSYEEGLIMTYTERLKHKTRLFEIGKDCIAQLISSPKETEKISRYIDKKMYEYLSRLIDSN